VNRALAERNSSFAGPACNDFLSRKAVMPARSTSSIGTASLSVASASAIENGDPHASGQLLPLVYDELRKLATQKLAQEKPGQTLQATALVAPSRNDVRSRLRLPVVISDPSFRLNPAQDVQLVPVPGPVVSEFQPLIASQAKMEVPEPILSREI
jgi:hypothetical protein